MKNKITLHTRREFLRHTVLGLTREYVAAPTRELLIRYAQAREALQSVQR